MSYQERDNLSKLATKLVDASESEKKLHGIEQVSTLFTKITRYGLSE